MGSSFFLFDTHWAHEPDSLGGVRALCSVAACGFDALVRVARWEDWFWLATFALIGDLLARGESRWEDLFGPVSLPGTAADNPKQSVYANIANP